MVICDRCGYNLGSFHSDSCSYRNDKFAKVKVIKYGKNSIRIEQINGTGIPYDYFVYDPKAWIKITEDSSTTWGVSSAEA